MATAKKTVQKKAEIDDNAIISLYMNDILEDNHNTKNVYVFCKKNEIAESDFYTFFGSLDGVKQAVWKKFLENAIATLDKDSNYQSYPNKNKLLSLYFTLFEILTLNRSYVIYSLEENDRGLKNIKDLKSFKNEFKDFVKQIIDEDESLVNDRVSNITKPIFSEGAWVQFLFILKFWMDDTSKSFEKTDILIEKSVNTVVDLLDTKPLESLFDLGKFLFKENRN